MNKSCFFFSVLLLGLGGCETKSNSCDPEGDADADGILDCQEEELGTDPLLADSDGDGLSDQEEVDCVSDPLNADEQCYACGWEHNDPHTLESTGSDLGDVMANFQLEDTCGDAVSMWDFHGEYHILFMTAAWWGGCAIEAGGLQENQDQFIAETGLGFSFLFALYEGASGDPATVQDAIAYHERIGSPSFPVFADGNNQIAGATPLTAMYHPEMCALTPEMEIISCYNGHGGYESALDDIKAHAGM